VEEVEEEGEEVEEEEEDILHRVIINLFWAAVGTYFISPRNVRI